MRQAIRTKSRQGQVSQTATFPAPVGGWNTRDPVSAMPPQDAIKLDNWFPTTTDCEIRGGTSAYSTGITGTVETLAKHTASDGTDQLFAVTTTDVYDCSSSGAASAESLAVTNARYQWLNMGDGTSSWLMMFNGVDKPKYYQGTTWTQVDSGTSPALTGITSTSAVAGCQFHGRLFLLEKDTLSFWYLPAGAVGGLAVEFDLSSFCTRGGYIEWVDTWTQDGGDGTDDYIVFMTSEGEAVIYTGTDPSTATKWARLGTFFLGKPLGRRAHIKFDGDLLAMTQGGVFNMSQGLKSGLTDEKVSMTDKIRDTFNRSARDVGTAFGWEVTHYPLRGCLIFNVPLSSASVQYVVNTTSWAWCRFTGWDAECFITYNDELYFGGSTVVTKAWTGVSDLGANIVAEGKTAFTSFGENTQLKRVTMYRPMLQTNGTLSYLTDIEVDFNDTTITGQASYTPTTGAVWGTSVWGTGLWQGGLSTVRQWSSPDVSTGYFFAGKLKIETKTTQVHWSSCDYVYERGGVI